MERVVTTATYVAEHSVCDYDREWHDIPEDIPDVVEPIGKGWRLVSMSSVRADANRCRIFWCWERTTRQSKP